MATDLTHQQPRTLDLTGLPESAVQEILRIAREAREKQAGVAPPGPQAGEGRGGTVGMFDHLGVQTPSLEEFEAARREMWANFPRDFPDPSK